MVIPFFGLNLVLWIWSNFYVSVLTLKLFFSIHFVLPLVLILLILFHLIFLHNYSRTSKIYFHRNLDKITFYPYFFYKDLFNILILILLFIFILFNSYYFNDSEIFLEINHLISPIHIIPEWYFLFAYGILRSINNKSLGVILLLIRILIFYFFILKNKIKNNKDILNKIIIFWFVIIRIILSWLGSCLVEFPFFLRSLFIRIIYFKIIIIIKIIN
jgi:ubiquinol-cytochrome c reductase cytochrome b subunit